MIIFKVFYDEFHVNYSPQTFLTSHGCHCCFFLTQMSNLKNAVMFPLEIFSKSDTKESQVDTRKLFEKSYKDLETKL